MNFTWSSLPYITNSQVRLVEQLRSQHEYVRFVDKLDSGSIVLHCNHKQITVTKSGRIKTTIVTARSIAWYLHSLHLANLLYNVDDDINSLVWLDKEPTAVQLAQMQEAHQAINEWRASSTTDVFSLYPDEAFVTSQL